MVHMRDFVWSSRNLIAWNSIAKLRNSFFWREIEFLDYCIQIIGIPPECTVEKKKKQFAFFSSRNQCEKKMNNNMSVRIWSIKTISSLKWLINLPVREDDRQFDAISIHQNSLKMHGNWPAANHTQKIQNYNNNATNKFTDIKINNMTIALLK